MPALNSSENSIIDLINKANGLELTTEDVTLEEGGYGDGDPNTLVKVTAKPDFEYSGSVDILYNRLDLAELFHLQPDERLLVPISGTPDLGATVCAINTEYGTTFDSDEFDNGPENESNVLRAKFTNLAYQGSVRIIFVEARQHLQDRLTETELDGFLYGDENIPSLRNPVQMHNLRQSGNYLMSTGLIGVNEGDASYHTGIEQVNNGELVIQAAIFYGRAFRPAGSSQNNYDLMGMAGAVSESDQKRIFAQTRTQGDTPRGSWKVAMVFGAPEGSPLLVSGRLSFAKLAEFYDIEMITRTQSTEKPALVEAPATFDLAQSVTSNRLVLKRPTGAVVNGSNTPVTGADISLLGTTVERVSINADANWFPGLSSWGAGQGAWARFNGKFDYVLTATPKNGRGKPLVVHLFGNTDPQ